MDRPQAIVTGASRGIGRAIALELATQGFDVAFTYRSSEAQAREMEKELEAKGARAKAYGVDMADAPALQSAMEKILADFPAVELLVNNAGISIDGLAARFKTEDFDSLMNTNVRAGFIASQAVMRPMMKARRGSIVFISSVIGLMGNGGQAPYSTTKAALFGMTKSLARELGSRNIRVNAVAPGYIKTDMTESLPQASKEGILSGIPLGYLGEPEDVARVVAFLASPASRYITGQILSVNGGLYM